MSVSVPQDYSALRMTEGQRWSKGARRDVASVQLPEERFVWRGSYLCRRSTPRRSFMCLAPVVEAPPTLVFERWVSNLIFRVLECVARQTIALHSCPLP